MEKETRGRKSTTKLQAETLMLMYLQTGGIFYTSKEDKNITAQATYLNKKVLTERCVLITGTKSEPIANTLTKVTVL